MRQALGLASRGGLLPAGLSVVSGRFADLVLAPMGADAASRLSLQVACHRGSAAFLPLPAHCVDLDPDAPELLARLERFRGRSVLALEPPRRPGPRPAPSDTGAGWLRARRASILATADDRARLADLAAALPRDEAALIDTPHGPVALLLTATGACEGLGAAAHAAWPGLVISAPWPVLGFDGAGSLP